MKKKLVVAMLVATLTMGACSSAPSNTAESTETPVSTEAMVQAETEVSTEKVAESTEDATTEIQVATEAVEATEIAEETTEAEPEFAVVAMSATKYAKSSVNVRKGPSSHYEKIGSLSINQKVKVIGQADTGWYQIELDGEIAYVSNNYLVDEKVAVNTTSGSNKGSENNSDASSGDVATTPGTGNGDMESDGNDGENESTTDGDIWGDDWGDDWDSEEVIGGGTGEPITDGYGPGVEIEITPMP